MTIQANACGESKGCFALDNEKDWVNLDVSCVGEDQAIWRIVGDATFVFASYAMMLFICRLYAYSRNTLPSADSKAPGANCLARADAAFDKRPRALSSLIKFETCPTASSR